MEILQNKHGGQRNYEMELETISSNFSRYTRRVVRIIDLISKSATDYSIAYLSVKLIFVTHFYLPAEARNNSGAFTEFCS